MKDINIRFKQLREACDKTQAEFGKVLGLSVSGVSDIERGKRNVTEQHLIMLSNWKERMINIDWLRTGEGDMFINVPETVETAMYVSELIENPDDPFCQLIIEVMKIYSELSPKSKEVFSESARKLRDNLAKKREG